MRNELTLNFGPPTLSRLRCDICGEETLHVRGLCNHCAAQAKRSKSAFQKGLRSRVSKVTSPWRAEHDAMCKARMKVQDRAHLPASLDAPVVKKRIAREHDKDLDVEEPHHGWLIVK